MLQTSSGPLHEGCCGTFACQTALTKAVSEVRKPGLGVAVVEIERTGCATVDPALLRTGSKWFTYRNCDEKLVICTDLEEVLRAKKFFVSKEYMVNKPGSRHGNLGWRPACQ